MQKFKILFFLFLAALSFIACEPDNGINNGETVPQERISFTLNGDEPIVAAPDEEIIYDFTVSYPHGLESIVTLLDGEEIPDSEVRWDEAPVEANYTFKYVVKGSQFGETLDFVFSATGVDGYTCNVDYAVWVTANAVEFTTSVPENLPTKMYSNETLEFDVNIECGNVLKSIQVTKNGVDFLSKTDFTNEKTYKYPFVYTPAKEDIGKDVEFHFIVTDVKGNLSEAYYTVNIVKADVVGKMLYSEIFDTSMSISGTEAFNTSEGGITGGTATQFTTTNIVKYNTLFVSDPNNPEEMIENKGAMEGCQVYDNDKTALTYTSDGKDVCLSKYYDTRWTEISGAYLWYRKSKGGWFRVDGIKLHQATYLKLTYTQSTSKSNMKVEYSLDNGSSWTEIITTTSVAQTHEQKFTLSQAAETISLRFTEAGGNDHCRIDNIKLVEII